VINSIFKSQMSIIDFYEINRKVIGEEVIILDSPLKSKLSKFSYIFFNIKRRIFVKDRELNINGKKKKVDNIFQNIRDIFEEEKLNGKEEDREFFTSGAFTLFSYDFGKYLEKTHDISVDDLNLPDLYMAFPGEIIVKDELNNLFYYCGNIKKDWKDGKIEEIKIKYSEIEKGNEDIFKKNIDKSEFYEMVEKAKRYIKEGDIFQVNLSQRFSAEFNKKNGLELYKILRKINPSPFASYVNTEDFSIISQSPERLIALSKDRIAQSRPIAGTRRFRQENEAEMENELLLSEKERAEHVMLVDLERNDIGKIAKFGTVSADEFMIIEKYSHVMHIVSNIKGELREDIDWLELICSMFPGGTITGAPKIRSMEIIEELEPTKRGFYTGSLGFVGFNGTLDINIIIRSFILKSGYAYFQTGAGIVYDSEPEKEYFETINKARAMMLAYKNFYAGREF
jgi:para-aminobenzoate synthetase component I